MPLYILALTLLILALDLPYTGSHTPTLGTPPSMPLPHRLLRACYVPRGWLAHEARIRAIHATMSEGGAILDPVLRPINRRYIASLR